MKKIAPILAACGLLAACAAPAVITGNSRSVVIDNGQYMKSDGLLGAAANHAAEASVKAAADEWCAKYGRVSSVEKGQGDGRRKEFECVER